MKEVNPLIWGAVAGVGSAIIIALSQATNTVGPDNPLLESPFSAGGVGFFFGWAAGSIRNWFGRRP